MAWGMFLAIPCPFRRWDEAARGRMLGFLPLIGLIVGAIWAAAARLCTALNLPSAVRALILCALPWLVTGFLHLDGFMDVCDAVLSRRDLETRQRILKDSHCGSFAVICMILLAAAQWSLFFSFESFDFKALLTLAVLPACTRACSGIAVQTLKPASTAELFGARPPLFRSLFSSHSFLYFPRCSAAKSVLRRLRLLRYIGLAFCAKKSSSAA